MHVVVNLEVWPFDKQMPRAIIQHAHGKIPMPDIANFSWVEYGLRCGLPRMLQAFASRAIPVSNCMNAAFPQYYPSAAEAVAKAGWELMGHGLFQRSLLYEDDERAVIEEAIERYKSYFGKQPRGWLGAGFGESLKTPDILRELGFEYIHDWMVDDVPTWMHTEAGPMVAMPYGLDLNDVTVYSIEHRGEDEYLGRFAKTAQWFASHETGQPRVITLALHPHLVATPYRIQALCDTLDMLQTRGDTIFMTGPQIMDWFTAQIPAHEVFPV